MTVLLPQWAALQLSEWQPLRINAASALCRVVQAQEAIAEAHAEPETPTGMAIIRQVQTPVVCRGLPFVRNGHACSE